MSERFGRRARLWWGGVAVLALLLTTAVPGSAAPSSPEKIYKLAVTSPSPNEAAANSPNQIFDVRLTNITDGNSNFNSFVLTAPNGFIVTGASVLGTPESSNANTGACASWSSGSTCGATTLPTATNVVWAQSLDPVKSSKSVANQQFVTIRVTVTTPVINGCSAPATTEWGDPSAGTTVYTGSNLSGDTFRQAQRANASTTLTANCSLKWDQKPSDGVVGTAVSPDPRLKVVDANGNTVTAATGTASIQIVSGPTNAALSWGTNSSPVAFSNGVATFTNFQGTKGGVYVVKGTSTGYGQTNTTTDPASFTLNAVDSSISGKVWRDHNNDGSIATDGSEDGQGGWIIKAFNASGDEVGTATSSPVDATLGNYSIGSLPSGATYTVCEFAPLDLPPYEYRGWLQSKPGSSTPSLCAGFSASAPDGFEVLPNGYSVTIPGPGTNTVADRDFGNVRTIEIPGNTITVECDALPSDPFTFTVGNGTTEPVGEVTISQAGCKPGVYVFESYIDGNGDQVVDFHPTFDPTGDIRQITQTFTWVGATDKTQSVKKLYYDDFVAGVPEREMLFCKVNADGSYKDMPDPVGDDTKPHTTCLMQTVEKATPGGSLRTDTTITLVDGKTRFA
jgi:hypothetical protein